MRIAAALLLAITLGGCATVVPQSAVCSQGETAMTVETLYFGTGRKDAEPVSRAEWESFLASAVTPRFPQGLTWWEANGQWRSNDGTLWHERSYVLQLAYGASRESDANVQAIIALYRKQFEQEAVMRERAPSTCVSF